MGGQFCGPPSATAKMSIPLQIAYENTSVVPPKVEHLTVRVSTVTCSVVDFQIVCILLTIYVMLKMFGRRSATIKGALAPHKTA